jgi:hypothetical protein
LPVLEGEAALLLVPGEDGRRDDAVPVDLIPHLGQGLAAGIGAYHHLSTLEDFAPEGSEILEEVGDQSFIARALPHQAIA